MVDLSDKVSESEDMNSQAQTPERVSSSSDGTQIKTCTDCGTTKTPLWRGGPAGPKSLCNACGIRSRKKRRALLGLNKEEKKPKKSTSSSSSNNNNNNSSSTSNNYSSGSGDSNSSSGFSLKRKLLSFGRDVVVPLQRPRSSTNGQRRKLGEVEQAAFLLMALSCGSVYA
ncbi:GATA transcription factor 16 [Coffea eugenioides]|uniref:GATA transcription factor 16 n=1 Tax=Coffea eugenioides TaxID=49369 RepID=UPI000F6104A7|nr:GATA transcription factor 16 [Coffea eugenioides]